MDCSLCPVCPPFSAQPSTAAALRGAVLTSTSADSEGDRHAARIPSGSGQPITKVSRRRTLPAYEYVQ